MKFSVVINTYNRMTSLPTALNALRFLRYPFVEVIVVDGPSDDGTLDYLKNTWSDRIKICRCAETNLSKSRNIGIRNASGDIVCFTDDDGIPEPNWLDKLITAYDDQQVAAAGGWVRDHTGVAYQTKYIISTRDSGSEVLIEDPAEVPPARIGAEKFPGLIGVNSSFRRNALIEVGGFDEEYAYFLDETDVLVRLVDAGYSVQVVPDAEVHHKYAPSHIRADNGIAKSWLQIMKSTAYYIVKNSPPNRSLAESLTRVDFHKQELRRHSRWFRSEGLISEDHYNKLMNEIDDGAALGIAHAFEYPLRQLIGDDPKTGWKAFSRLSADRRIRLALVTSLYPPRPCGGVAVFMHTLAIQLAEFGHEVTVITQAEEGRPHTVDFEDGVWVHRLPSSANTASPDDMPDLPSSIAQFSAQVLAELDRVNATRQFECVMGSIWDLELAATIASGRYRTAMYLVTSYKLVQDSKPEWRANSHFFENHVCKMFDGEAWAIEKCTTVLASTKSILEDVSAAYGVTITRKRSHVIPFGIPSATLLPELERATDDIKLLFVGRLEERKGIATVLEALPAILSARRDLSIDIVGDDTLPDVDGVPFRRKFQERHSGAPWLPRVRFQGHVDNEQLLDFYRTCSIFLAPSKYESFGLIFLEAMRFAKPCIGTNAGGIPEVVADGSTGILISPGNSAELTEAVFKLVDEPELRRTMGEAGRDRFKRRFTSEKFAKRIIEFVRQREEIRC